MADRLCATSSGRSRFSVGIGTADAPERLHGSRFADGVRFEICAYVEDVDAEIARLCGAGVAVLHEAEDKLWGERAAYVVDLDGNPVQLVAEVAESERPDAP